MKIQDVTFENSPAWTTHIQQGSAKEILLLEGFFEAGERPVLAHQRIATSVHCEEQLRMLEASPPPAPVDAT